MMIRPDNSDRLYRALREWILALAGVTEAPHRFGGTEFRVKGVEFMHSHGPRFLDIRLSMEDQERVLQEGKALRHRFAPRAGWVSFRILSEADAERVRELIGWLTVGRGGRLNLTKERVRRAWKTLVWDGYSSPLSERISRRKLRFPRGNCSFCACFGAVFDRSFGPSGSGDRKEPCLVNMWKGPAGIIWIWGCGNRGEKRVTLERFAVTADGGSDSRFCSART